MSSMGRARSRSASAISNPDGGSSSQVTPINYVFTASEVRAIQRSLARLGVLKAPSLPATPTTFSVPTTPTQLIPPSVYASWLDDEYLPLTSRKTIRAFLLGLSANVAMDGLLPAVMGKKR